MKVEELRRTISYLPNDMEIELIVADKYDNYSIEDTKLSFNQYDDKHIEMVLQLDDVFTIMFTIIKEQK